MTQWNIGGPSRLNKRQPQTFNILMISLICYAAVKGGFPVAEATEGGLPGSLCTREVSNGPEPSEDFVQSYLVWCERQSGS